MFLEQDNKFMTSVKSYHVVKGFAAKNSNLVGSDSEEEDYPELG